MAHPIRPEKVIEMNNFYTVTVYEKGAEVIRMIHTLLGEELFQKGMQLYVAENDGKAATCEDFVSAMERASNIDLTQFRRWYSQSGTPELTVRDEYDENTQCYRLHISQLTEPTADQLEKLNLHIPVKLALYGETSGQKIPLIDENGSVGEVLSLTQAQQTFEFYHVSERPIPALLADFSAPVRLSYDYTTAQLIRLLTCVENDFSRWDMIQTLFNRELRENLFNYHQGDLMQFNMDFLEALKVLMDDEKVDTGLKALMLTLPKETEFAEQFKIIDPQGIAVVRQYLLESIATACQDRLFRLYQENQCGAYRVVAEDIDKRALRNVCLSYLAFTDQGEELVSSHYEQADNMTDTLAALTAATKAQLACQEELLADFEAQWSHDGLVMDKWFALQATRPDDDVLAIVEKLMAHPSFNFNNPNRVRALVGAFASQNPKAFHAVDGSGYRFLVEVLIKLNESNPQVAARLIEPLIKLSRYDNQRQTLMRRGLERLKGLDNLARDLFEKIEKALL